ncbi:MAG: RDD family protein [Bacilli bacterium]|nr:RDD family protein [Bacilli bacterium]
MHKIVLAGLGKRALAAIADLALAILIGMGVFALSQAIFDNTSYSSSLKSSLSTHYSESGLYYVDGDGNVRQYDGFENYTDYQNIVLKYYTEYMVSGAPAEYRHPEYTTYWYNVMILGQDDVKSLYSAEELSKRDEPSKNTGKAYFEYQGTNYDELAMPIKGFYIDGDVSKGLTSDAKMRLLSFYYDANNVSVYYNAGSHLVGQKFIVDLTDQYNAITKTYPLLISIALIYPLWYMVLPMILGDGVTIGKKITGLCLCNSYGFKIKRPQLILRSIPMAIFMLIVFFFFGNVYGVMAVSGMMLVSYLMSIFTPDHKALHDYMAMTMVLDAKESVFFKDAEEQEKAESAFEEIMKRADEMRASVDLTEGDPTIERPGQKNLKKDTNYDK